MARQILVEIVGDARPFTKATEEATHKASAFSGFIANAGSVMTGFLGAQVVGNITNFIGESVKGAIAAQQLAATTDAVIKSTGGVAGITAQHVGNLADQIKNLTGVDDDAVRGGENLLLTFTNLRNEAGAGNDIFDQSTKIMTDMSVALGQDMKSSAIQLGKALNDPIQGMTALQRVGVSFTEDQKKQITTLQQHGNLLGAQKIILGELNREFGGAAKAAGNSTGSMEHMQAAISDAGKAMATLLLPAIDALSPKVVQLANWTSDTLVPAVQKFSGWMKDHQDLIKAIAIGVGAVGIAIMATMVPALWATAVAGVAAAIPLIPLYAAILAIGIVVAAVAYAWEHNMFGIRDKAKVVVDYIVPKFQELVNFLRSAASTIGSVLGPMFNSAASGARAAFNAIATFWNHTVGRLNFKIPSWVPGIGGDSFHVQQLPTFHQGGTVPGPFGSEQLILAKAGETVSPHGSGNGTPTIVININGGFIDGPTLDRIQHELAQRLRFAPGT